MTDGASVGQAWPRHVPASAAGLDGQRHDGKVAAARAAAFLPSCRTGDLPAAVQSMIAVTRDAAGAGADDGVGHVRGGQPPTRRPATSAPRSAASARGQPPAPRGQRRAAAAPARSSRQRPAAGRAAPPRPGRGRQYSPGHGCAASQRTAAWRRGCRRGGTRREPGASRCRCSPGSAAGRAAGAGSCPAGADESPRPREGGRATTGVLGRPAPAGPRRGLVGDQVHDALAGQDQHHLVVGVAVIGRPAGRDLADELGGGRVARARPEQHPELPVPGHLGRAVPQVGDPQRRRARGPARAASAPARPAGWPGRAGQVTMSTVRTPAPRGAGSAVSR